MRIRAESVLSGKKKTEVLCAFCFEDTNAPIGLGKLNKKISENLLYNQDQVVDFLTDIFDYMKNSSFKI